MIKSIFIVIINIGLYLLLNFSGIIIEVKASNPIIFESSSKIASDSNNLKEDTRVEKLKNFLKGYPLENSAPDFIKIADKYGLEKHVFLVAAISGVESTFGKFIPTGSYNAWGFGIPTGTQSGIVFSDWKSGIEEVTKTLATSNLYPKGEDFNNLTVEEFVYLIGPTYAASPVWAQKVCYFLNKIEETPSVPNSTTALTINL